MHTCFCDFSRIFLELINTKLILLWPYKLKLYFPPSLVREGFSIRDSFPELPRSSKISVCVWHAMQKHIFLNGTFL